VAKMFLEDVGVGYYADSLRVSSHPIMVYFPYHRLYRVIVLYSSTFRFLQAVM